MSEKNGQREIHDCTTYSTILNTVEWGYAENTPTYTVISAVAEVEDTAPAELPPLYDVIDPEALNALFTSRSGCSVEQISFQYVEYSVVVCEDGKVQVRPGQRH